MKKKLENKIHKGILLAGGSGTRFKPFTNYLNKHLLPLYKKPIIYYPLANLLQARIRDILIITNPEYLKTYKNLFGNGNQLGINIRYSSQKKPIGLPDAFLIGQNFIKKENVCLNLGDHILYGNNLTKILSKINYEFTNSTILSTISNQTKDSSVPIYSKNILKKIIEKPNKKIGNRIICGLYFYDNEVISRSKSLRLSKRKELEITDLNNSYINDNKLKLVNLDNKINWDDAGDPIKVFKAAKKIANYEAKYGEVAFLEKIALENKFINLREFNNLIDKKL